MWAAWRYGGEDPWRTYNMLDADFRPIWAPELPAMRPKRPSRYRAFMYACGRVALKIEGKMERDPAKVAAAAAKKRARRPKR